MKKIICIFSVFFFASLSAASLYEQTGAAQKFMRGDVGGAFSEYNQLLMQYPTDPILNYNMGTVLYNSGKLVEAESYFTRAVQGKNISMQWLSLANLGNVYAHQKKYDEAIEVLEKALSYELKKEDKERLQYNFDVIKQLKREEQKEDEKSSDQDKKDQEKNEQKDQDQKQCDDCQNKEQGDSGDSSEDQKSSDEKESSDDKSMEDKQKDADGKDEKSENKNDEKSLDDQKETGEQKSSDQKSLDEKKQDQKSAQQKSQEKESNEQKSSEKQQDQSDQDQKMADQAQQAEAKDFAQENEMLQNALQKELEQGSADDERLSIQEAALMDAYDEREELIGKQVIAKRMAVQQQGGGVPRGKNW